MGKTLKMLILAIMATCFNEDALVFFAAKTHRVVSAFEEIAKNVFKAHEIMPMRVAATSTSDKVVDCGLAWLQATVDAATTEETELVKRASCCIDILEATLQKHPALGNSHSEDGQKDKEACAASPCRST